ncbi:unnamed protein product [Lymnaea stagnalis]|uniref:Uncharacterized protein n=1 Tax=Lymnaea stagnalis TaxID=6523 RepID=A0AAV2H680_LYMST
MSVKLCVLNICLALIVLSVEGRASNPFITYDKAKEVWTNRKCMFPDQANFKNSTSLLEPCSVTNNSTVTESSVEKVCEAFFRLSIQMCYATSPNQEYVDSKLKPELLQHALDFTDDDVCQYASNLNFSNLPYLDELRNYTQCSQHCLNSALNTKPICQLLISALCSFFGKNLCQPGKKYPIAESTLNSSRTTNASLVTSTPPTSEKNNTSDPTQQKSTGKESERTTLTADDVTEKILDGVPVSAAIQTAKSAPDKTTAKYDPKPSQKLDDVEPTDVTFDKDLEEPDPKSTEDSEGKGTDARKKIGELDDEDIKNEENEEEDTGKGKPKGEEEEDTGKGKPKGEEEEDTGKGKPKGEEEGTDQGSKDGEVKSKISGTGDGGKAQGSRRNGENKDINQTAEEEESNGSGHFLAYFLTAVVICIAGYIIYHNKQKIMAFVIEGRSNHSGRQRSKGVKYTELKSNVEEVLPSLEKSATAKNFVY